MAGLRRWLVLLLLVPGLAAAEPPLVRQIILQRTPEALLLTARLSFTPHGAVRDALLKGVPLYFVWDATVLRERWYWTDKRIGSQRRVLRLVYQPLTRLWRVSVSNDAGGGVGAGLQYALHQTHDTLEDALAAVARIARWRLADAAQLEPGADHYVQFGFRLDLTLLPRPFQIGLGTQEEWTIAFEQRLPVPEQATPEGATEARAAAAEGGGTQVEAGKPPADAPAR